MQVRYRQDAGNRYVPGYPADSERVIDVADDVAEGLVSTGLYEAVGDSTPPAETPPADPPQDTPPQDTPPPADEPEGDTFPTEQVEDVVTAEKPPRKSRGK